MGRASAVSGLSLLATCPVVDPVLIYPAPIVWPQGVFFLTMASIRRRIVALVGLLCCFGLFCATAFFMGVATGGDNARSSKESVYPLVCTAVPNATVDLFRAGFGYIARIPVTVVIKGGGRLSAPDTKRYLQVPDVDPRGYRVSRSAVNQEVEAWLATSPTTCFWDTEDQGRRFRRASIGADFDRASVLFGVCLFLTFLCFSLVFLVSLSLCFHCVDRNKMAKARRNESNHSTITSGPAPNDACATTAV